MIQIDIKKKKSHLNELDLINNKINSWLRHGKK